MLNPDLLRRHPLFEAVPCDQLAELAQLSRWATGELLCREHETAHSLFVVESGRIRVLRRSEDGRELTVGSCMPGELIGDYSLLAPHRCAATCRASMESGVWSVPLRNVLALIRTTYGNAPLRSWLKLQYLVRFLRNECYLGFMSGASFLPMLERCEELSFDAGETIQAETLYGESVFLVMNGTVCQDGARPDVQSTEKRAGDLLGVEAWMGRPVPCMVAQSSVRCWRIPRSCVHEQSEAADVHQSLLKSQRSASLHFPFVRQSAATDCGCASLAMVAAFHRVPLTVESIRAQVFLGDRGASLAELRRAAECLGFDARAVRISCSHLTGATLPAIAHLRGDHYVVIYSADQEYVIVGDPAVGILQRTRQDLDVHWDGTLLLVRPTVGG